MSSMRLKDVNTFINSVVNTFILTFTFTIADHPQVVSRLPAMRHLDVL